MTVRVRYFAAAAEAAGVDAEDRGEHTLEALRAAVVAEHPERHVGRTYDLVGEPVTANDVATRLGVDLVDVSLQSKRVGLDAAGLKPFQPAMLLSIFTSVRHGFVGASGSDLRLLLEREPRDAVQAAAETASAGRPNA